MDVADVAECGICTGNLEDGALLRERTELKQNYTQGKLFEARIFNLPIANNYYFMLRRHISVFDDFISLHFVGLHLYPSLAFCFQADPVSGAWWGH